SQGPLYGVPAGAQRSGSGGERRRSEVSAACRCAAGGGIRSLCRRRAEQSESPLAGKESTFSANDTKRPRRRRGLLVCVVCVLGGRNRIGFYPFADSDITVGLCVNHDVVVNKL